MIQRTRLACRLSKPQNCLGLDRGPHLGQRTWCRVNRPDTCSQSTRPSEFLVGALAFEGPFSNRASFVNSHLLSFVRLTGSRFSPRSEMPAATSGSKHRRCNVHNGLVTKRPNGLPRSRPVPSPRVGNSSPRRVCDPSGISSGLLSCALVVPTSERPRPSARCYAGSRRASWLAPLGLCQYQIALRSPAPNPSGSRRA